MPYSSEGYSNSNLFSSVRHLYCVRGLGYLIRKAFWYLIDMYFSSFYYNKFRSSETFQFQGKDYHYVFQRYCTVGKMRDVWYSRLLGISYLNIKSEAKKYLKLETLRHIHTLSFMT